VTVDGAGHPWVNELGANTVIRLDPATENMQVIKLPTRNTGIRKMIVAAMGACGTWARTPWLRSV